AYALVAGSLAAWRRRRRLALSAQNALLASFATTIVAANVLFVALGRRDMSFVYVAQHTSHHLPLGYALSAFWGGQEGSLLLWLIVLTGYASVAVWLNRRSRELMAWTVLAFALVAVFFTFMLAFASSPFNVLPPPAAGHAWVRVEIAALMLSLAARGFVHWVRIQEKRGMLEVWNRVLVALAVKLSLFGTFLTRSGVIDAIHSFSQSPIGGWFLGFLVFMVV